MIRDDGNEMAGMKDARKLNATGNLTQRVTVTARRTCVELDIEYSTYPAGLTPAQARFFARKLYRMARLVEQRLAAADTSDRSAMPRDETQ